jgi:hypothetical protein
MADFEETLFFRVNVSTKGDVKRAPLPDLHFPWLGHMFECAQGFIFTIEMPFWFCS